MKRRTYISSFTGFTLGKFTLYNQSYQNPTLATKITIGNAQLPAKITNQTQFNINLNITNFTITPKLTKQKFKLKKIKARIKTNTTDYNTITTLYDGEKELKRGESISITVSNPNIPITVTPNSTRCTIEFIIETSNKIFKKQKTTNLYQYSIDELEYGLKDDFSGYKLQNRDNQKNGIYNASNTIEWNNAWIRPDWNPQTNDTFSMNNGTLTVRGLYARIRAPCPQIDPSNGVKFRIDMKHDNANGRMYAELGYLDENNAFNTLYRITNNSGNGDLSVSINVNDNFKNIYSGYLRSTSWLKHELIYDSKETKWIYKLNNSTKGTANYGIPTKKPDHIRLRNSSHDGYGGQYKNLYINN